MSRNFSPDESLIDNLLLDDTSSFEELHRRYCYSLYTYCLDKLNSPADAKRIVRDIFIELWDNRHSLPVNFSVSLHFYTEVRKAVVKCVNEKLLDVEEAGVIEKQLMPEFSVSNLQKARQPVKTKETWLHDNQHTSVIHRGGSYEIRWWNKYPSQFNLQGIKHAFRAVLNFW